MMTRHLLQSALVTFLALLAGSCIYTIGPAGDTEDESDDTGSPEDATELDVSDSFADAPDLSDARPDVDTDGVDADADTDGADNSLSCPWPPSSGFDADAGVADADTMDADTAGSMQTPLFVFVPKDAPGRLGVAYRAKGDGDVRVESFPVPAKVLGLGPSIHYDEDGKREIPFIGEVSGDNRAFVATIGEDSLKTLEKPVSLPTDYTLVGIADLDDNCHPDVIWPHQPENSSTGQIRRIDWPESSADASSSVVYEPSVLPRSILGAVDSQNDVGMGRARPGDGREELYWFDVDSTGKYFVDGTTDVGELDKKSFEVTTSSGAAGVGTLRRIPSKTMWGIPFIDSNSNPKMLKVSSSLPFQLNDGGRSGAFPPAIVDLDGQAPLEFVMVDGDKLKYVPTDANKSTSSPKEIIDGSENVVEVSPKTGVVPGVSRFFQRLNQVRDPLPTGGGGGDGG